MSVYLDLARSAFLAAVPFPPSREIGLEAVRAFGTVDMSAAFASMLLGSLAGAIITWYIGRAIGIMALKYSGPDVHLRWAKCSGHARTHGSLLLMCSWLAVVGPLIVFFAGALGVRFMHFLIITAIGKAIYYGFYAFF